MGSAASSIVKAIDQVPIAGSVVTTPIRMLGSVHSTRLCPNRHADCNSVEGLDAILQRWRCNVCGVVFVDGNIIYKRDF